MLGNQFGGGGDKFKSAQNGLQRQVVQLGSVSPQLMAGAPLRGEGNVAVAGQMAPDVRQVPIGKGAEGVRGSSPIKIMGQNPFGHEMAPAPAPSQFQPAPQAAPMQQPQMRPQYQPALAPAPQPQHQLGANQEVHVLVATLEGPQREKYEAVYEIVAPRGSRVLGVSERPV